MSDRYGLAPEMAGSERLKVQRGQVRGRFLRGAAIAFACLLGLWLTWTAVRPDPNVLESIPGDIIGTWQSSDPRYQDRGMVIRGDEVQLMLGAGEADVYPVTELRRTEEEDYVSYEFSYFTPDGESLLELRVLPDGTARLRNPPDVVWRRTP